MKEDIEVIFEKRLNEAVSSWLKRENNYPEKGKLDLEFKKSSIPQIIGQFNFEDILKTGQALISVEVKVQYWLKYVPEAKIDGYVYKWTINNLAVSWINNDYEFNLENVDSYLQRLIR